ncbi:MAG: hypothetical protein LAO79_25580 [Acidobacteriia bacterium]|nr:hypothetical protein [Terriglobia bacterium]
MYAVGNPDLAMGLAQIQAKNPDSILSKFSRRGEISGHKCKVVRVYNTRKQAEPIQAKLRFTANDVSAIERIFTGLDKSAAGDSLADFFRCGLKGLPELAEIANFALAHHVRLVLASH